MSMTEHQQALFQAVSAVEDAYVTMAPPRRKAAVLLRRIGAVAAALALMVGIAWFAGWLGGEEASHPTFVLKVQAADGTMEGVQNGQTYWNGYPYDPEAWDWGEYMGFLNAPQGGGNGFGNDMPLFVFDIVPTWWDTDENIELYYQMEISYGDKTVVMTHRREEHLTLLRTYGTVNVETKEPNTGWRVCGWFDETVDLHIAIRNKSSNEIVDELTVNVAYNEESNRYQITQEE